MQHMRLTSHDLTYGDGFSGSKQLRTVVSRFLTQHLQPVIPFTPAQINLTAGVTNAIEAIGWSLGDPGDGILLGRPFYTAFVADLGARAKSFVPSQPVLQPLTCLQTEDRYCIFRRYRPFQS